MPDAPAPAATAAPVSIPDVPPSALQQQLKGQLRIGVAAIGGALVLKHVLPAWMLNDATVDWITGVLMLGAMAAWQWGRAKLIHSRFWALATNPRVPNDIIKPQG